MGADETVCRLCLQIIQGEPYSTLTEKNAVFRDLNVIPVKNLDLTEDPILCNLCDNKLNQLKTFKDTIIANELKIQTNHKSDQLEEFLQDISNDIEAICRLCLKCSTDEGKLEKNWVNCVKLFFICSIKLNTNIANPTKVCSKCDTTLQCVSDFVTLCMKNEAVIVKNASKNGKLVLKDLLNLSEVAEQDKTENKMDVARESINIENCPGTSKSSFQPTNSDAKESIQESLKVTKTPNTSKYSRNKSKISSLASKELPSTSTSQNLNVLTNRKFILKKMNEQLRQMHSSINASPVSLNDTTLEASQEGIVQEEPSCEYNMTQELIDVLEGRLNDSKAVIVNEEEEETALANDEEEETGLDKNIVITVEVETEPEPPKNKRKKFLPLPISDDLEVKKTPGQKMYSLNSKTEQKNSEEKSLTSGTKKQIKVIDLVTIPKEMQKNYSKKDSVSLENNKQIKIIDIAVIPKENSSNNSQASETVKIIDVSLEEEADKSPQSLESEVKVAEITKKSRGRPKKSLANNPKAANSNLKQQTILASFQKIEKLSTDNLQKDPAAVPSDTPENTDGEIIVKQSEDKSENETPKKSPAKKRMNMDVPVIPVLPLKRARKVVKPAAEISTNEGSSESSDDEFVEKKTDKPVTVTIIKSKKRTNKAELDKTWEQLTGKPLVKGEAKPETSNKPVEDNAEGVVKRKRGRPRLPDSEKKNQKPAKKREWWYCSSCPYKAYAETSFIQHQYIHNVIADLPVLTCEVCNKFTTTNSELLAQHKASHSTANLNFKCLFCDHLFKKKNACMFHTLRHDDQDVASQFYCMVYNGEADEEYFECFQCNYQNVDESPMPDHVIDHTIENPCKLLVARFKCELCPYRTKSEDTLKRHYDLHKYKEEQEKKSGKKKVKEETWSTKTLFSCDYCHFLTRNRRSLLNHRALKHKGCPKLVDPSNPKKPRTPKPKKPKTEDKPEEKMTYYCNECSYSTQRKQNMPRHVLVHKTKSSMEFYECAHCVFESKHRRSYTRHLEVIHGVIA